MSDFENNNWDQKTLFNIIELCQWYMSTVMFIAVTPFSLPSRSLCVEAKIQQPTYGSSGARSDVGSS